MFIAPSPKVNYGSSGAECYCGRTHRAPLERGVEGCGRL
jgi:hypothetical protein